jgi:predicted site-specific integrase-resolvase
VSAQAGRRVWTEQDIRGLGAATDLVTAAAILGIGRSTAHALARAGEFPVPVIRVGRRYRVPVAPILQLLGLDPSPPAA